MLFIFSTPVSIRLLWQLKTVVAVVFLHWCLIHALLLLNTNIYSNVDTFGGQCSNLYLNVVHFFNISDNWTSVEAQDSCFLA